MGSLGKGGERISPRPVDASKCAYSTQLVFAPSLMSEMAATRVGKTCYFGDELYFAKPLPVLELTAKVNDLRIYRGTHFF